MTSSPQISPYLDTPSRSSLPQRVSAHRRHYLLCTVWSLASLTGCMRADQDVERPLTMMSDPAQPEEVEVDTPEDSSMETPTNTPDPEVTDPEVTDPEVTDPEVTDPEVTDPEIVEPEMLDICAPRPVIYRNRWSIAPRLKAWVDELADETCSVQSQELEPTITQLRGASRFGYRGDESCDDSGCWVTLPSATRTWYEAPDDRRGFLDSGEVWVGVIDARRHLESGEVEAYLIASQMGHAALREIQRSWDADGHILHDQHSFNRQLWSDVTYTWSGDHITEIDFQDHVNGTSGYRFSYDYDDQGRLSGTRVDAGRHEHESRWTYDAQGRPASVLRLTARGGALQPWLHQAWSYHDQGGLSTQTNIVNFELAWGAMSSQLGHGAVLDSYQPITHMSQHDWDRQAARVTTQPNGVECFMLPTGIEIGYPSDAHVYDLGWPAHMRPEGIDTLHGFQRIYRVGMLGWMSHFGVEGENSPVASYLALAQQQLQGDQAEPGESPQVIRSVISYDGVHAVSEEVSAYAADQAGVTDQAFVIEDQATPTVISQRQRAWRGGQLTSDRVTLLDGVARTFHFTYDAEGRVTERSLHRDDALIARYTWAYHPDSNNLPRVCQISRYELGYVSAAVTEFWSETFPPQGHDETLNTGRDDEEAFDMRAAYTATLGGSDFGRCDQYQLTGPVGFELEVSFDERGRLTRQRGDVALSPLRGDNIEVVYHAEHDHITRISTLDAEGEVSLYSYEYAFDEAGRLIAHSAIDQSVDLQGESGVVHHEDFAYECR